MSGPRRPVYTEAMYNLGVLLSDSDPDQARRWYERAAQAGHAGAMYSLGCCSSDSDPDQAREWWQRAAQAGHAGAMHNLGVLLRTATRTRPATGGSGPPRPATPAP